MSDLPTVAVIGAGSSGIAAAKALHERGIPFDCFEASDRVGGNWVFGNKQRDVGGLPRPAHQHLARAHGVLGLPDAEVLSRLPAPHQIAAYFDDYVDHFGFRDRIRFETSRRARRARGRRRVGAHARRRREPRATTRCSSPTATTGTRAGPSRRSPAATRSRATQIHAHDYVDDEPVRGQGRRRARHGQQRDGHRRRGRPTSRERPTSPPAAAPGSSPSTSSASPTDQLPQRPAGARSRCAQRIVRAPASSSTRRHAGELRPAQARPQVRRGAPDGLRAHPRPHPARRDHAQAEHRAPATATRSSSPTARACTPTSSSTARATRSRSRSSTRTSSPRPTTTSSCSAASSTRASTTSSSSGCCSRSARSCRWPRRRGSGSPTTCAASTRCRRAAEMRADIARRPRGDAQALRRLQAPHDPGRLRRLPAATWARSAARGAERARAAGLRAARPARAAAPGAAERRRADRARRGPREATKAANRAAILRAAREVFADIGYGAATVRDIVRRTDLATGTFYNYFPDKESVLRALVDEIAERGAAPRPRRRGARAGYARGLRRRRLPGLLRVPGRGPGARSSSCAATRARSARCSTSRRSGAASAGAAGGPRRRRSPRARSRPTTPSSWPRRWSGRRSRSGSGWSSASPLDVDGVGRVRHRRLPGRARAPAAA